MPPAFATSVLCAVALVAGSSASLRPPKPISPIEGFYYEDDPRALRFGFQWSRTGSQYQFQLARDGTFSDIVVDRRVANDGLDLEGLGVGEYFWRVATVSAEGARGPFSAASCFLLSTTEREDGDHALTCAVLRSLRERRKAKRTPSGEVVAR